MPTGRTAFLLAIAASLNCFAFQTKDDRLCSIKGVVTNSVTREPVPKTYLRLIPTLGKKQISLSMSGGEGKFSFEGIEPGTYQIEARHQGFLDREFDEANGTSVEFKVSAGDKLGDVSIKLIPQAVLSGRVVDEEGEPWPHAGVNVAKSVFKDGKRSLQYAAGGREYMDDQGQFRIAELPPGRYFLFASPDESWETNFRPGDSHLQPTWYPSATDAGSSMPVVLAAGQSLSGIEIRLRRGVKEEYFIRGKVSSMEAIPPAQPGNPLSRPVVRASLKSDLSAQDNSANLRPDGSFEIHVARAGSYDVVV